jgi:hypothetical protein
MGTLEDLLQIAPLNIFDEEYKYKLARELKIRGYLDRLYAFDPMQFMDAFNRINKNQYLVHESNSTLSENSTDYRVNIFKYVNINPVRADILFSVDDREDFNINWPKPTYYVISCESEHNGEDGDRIKITENSKSNYIQVEIHNSILLERQRLDSPDIISLHANYTDFDILKSFILENKSLLVQFLHELMDCERNSIDKRLYSFNDREGIIVKKIVSPR